MVAGSLRTEMPNCSRGQLAGHGIVLMRLLLSHEALARGDLVSVLESCCESEQAAFLPCAGWPSTGRWIKFQIET
jgi:hypothetical protein